MKSFTYFNGKNILVTGGEGFVGFNFVQRLVKLGANVRATYYKQRPDFTNAKVEYIQCDLSVSKNSQKVVRDMDYVFHCAAVTSGAGGVLSNQLEIIKPNIDLNINILNASYKNKINKILILSSTTGYPDMGNTLLKEEYFFQDDPFDKYKVIGWINRYTEKLCEIFSEYGSGEFTTVVLRPTNIYGEYDNFDLKTSHVLPALIHKVVERNDPIEVWGTGNDVRDLIYIDDLIDAAISAMMKINRYQPINIGLGKGYSIKEILYLIMEVDKCSNLKVIYNQSKPSMIPVRLVDTKNAEHILGFKPKTSLKQGIQNTVEWYRKTIKRR